MLGKKFRDTPYGEISNRYLKNEICEMYQVYYFYFEAYNCKVEFLTSASVMPYQLLVTMRDLEWKRNGIETRVKLSFASFLQHNSSHNAVTESIDFENTAKSVSFLQNHPKSVTINQIFPVKIIVRISGGLPLLNALVS